MSFTFARLLILSVLSLTFLAPVPRAAATHTMYRVEDLGMLAGSLSSTAQGINERGQVVGWSNNGNPQAFVFTDGAGLVALASAPGYPSGCVARDINDLGQVAGSCGLGTSDQPAHAVQWSANGTPQDLGTLPGSGPSASSEAWGINDLGQVVGSSGTGLDFARGTHAFLYTPGQGMVDLTPEAGITHGYDINDNASGAQVVLGSTGSVLRWSNGVLEPLGAPAGYDYSYGFAINDLGHIVGSTKRAGCSCELTARYTDEAGWQVLGGAGEPNKLWGVNRAGVAVGKGRLMGGPEKAIIYTAEDGLQDLNAYIDSPEKWSIQGAYDINDAGQIAGQAMDIATGEFHAVRLTPIGGAGTQPAPAAPTNLAASSPTKGTVTLTWTDNSSNESGFRVERSTAATTGFVEIGASGVNGASYNDGGLASRTRYYYRVRAVNSGGVSTYSNTANVRVK